MHYLRWKANGDPLITKTPWRVDGSVDERFFSKIKKIETGCWLWTGCMNAHGYGVLGVPIKYHRLRKMMVHRWSYVHFKGPIPTDKVVGHLCNVRSCVNPDHLDVISRKENILTGTSPSAINAKKTHCKNGHSFLDIKNVSIRSDGGRRCRLCSKEGARKFKLESVLRLES